MKDSLQRIIWPDITKAFAIFLVVLGHIITLWDKDGYSNPIACWIYSFHMPLFMMLSGMFFKYTLDKSFLKMIKLKFRSLLLPLISWSLLLFFFRLLTSVDLNFWMHEIKIWVFKGGPLHGYWYLKCLFIYLLINYLTIKFLKNIWFSIILSTCLFLFLPNINFSRMMIPFFWLGYLYSIYNLRLIKVGGVILIFSGVIMIISYSIDWYKFTYLTSAHDFINYVKYLVMGTSSALFWLLLFNIIFLRPIVNITVKFISWIGSISLGIYCIHPFFYESEIYADILELEGALSLLFYFMWSVLVFSICIIIIKLIQKSNVLNFLLLGKKLNLKRKFATKVNPDAQ